jgi:hypothetical protein
MEFLKPSWYLGIRFAQGPVFFRILDREIIRYEPYEVGTVASGDSKSVDPRNTTYDVRILEPQTTDVFYQVFIGIDPEDIELYLKFPANTNRYDLAGIWSVGGKVKWIDGVISPFEAPAEESELFTFRDLYPVFEVYNAGDRDEYVQLSFHIAKYTYRIVRDQDTIQKLVEGRIPVKLWSFREPYSAPNWLVQMAGDVMAIGRQYWGQATR